MKRKHEKRRRGTMRMDGIYRKEAQQGKTTVSFGEKKGD